jgi:hypothetical protein
MSEGPFTKFRNIFVLLPEKDPGSDESALFDHHPVQKPNFLETFLEWDLLFCLV